MLLFYKKDFNPIYTNIIILIAYFGGNILVVLSPVFISFHLLLKLISVIYILIFSIVIVIKYNRINYLYLFVIFSYLFVYIISFNSNSLYYIAFIFIILAVVFLVYKFLSYLNILITLVVPLLLLIHLFLSYNSINDDFLVNRCYIIVFTILVYVLIGIDIINKINNVQRYIYILLLSIFVVISNIIIYNVGSITETFVIEHYIILISTMILFLLLCLLFIIYDLTALYPISMILTYAGLLPVISREDDFALISIFSVILIGIISVILPLSKLALIQNNNITHFIYGIVISGIANCLWVYYFLFGDQQLSYTTIGFIYVIVALLYFSVGTIIYYLSNKPQFQNIINIIYTFFGISVSVFSLSILFIFIDNPSIVSSVWLFESTILFYLYYKLNDSRIFVSANILMLLGASKIINPLFILYIHHYDYIYILYVIFVIISILISLFFVTRSTINNIVSKLCFFTYHFLYILIIICLYVIIFIVINSSSFYTNILITIIYMFLLSICYVFIKSNIISFVWTIFYIILLSFHTVITYIRINGLYNDIKIINDFFITILLALTIGIFIFTSNYYHLKNKEKCFIDINSFNSLFMVLKLCLYLYMFIITTMYVYFLYNFNIFSITIYWGILFFILLYYGMSKNSQVFRTAGFYIIILTICKIIMIDIWYELDDAIMRVIAFILLGAILITVSLLYRKKFNTDIKVELSCSNIIDNI